MLNEEELGDKIKGVKVVRGSPSISHIFFVNDSLIFCQANILEWVNV